MGNFSSIAARAPAGFDGYAAVKRGILAMTRVLAMKYGPSGTNVNGIAPGLVLTNFGGSALPPAAQEQFKASVLMRRIITVQDIANLVAFLVSDVAVILPDRPLA
jgi:3-oxoacyl-[acyl-carrier protein] reductase